jgi:hypothetical protein
MLRGSLVVMVILCSVADRMGRKHTEPERGQTVKKRVVPRHGGRSGNVLVLSVWYLVV